MIAQKNVDYLWFFMERSVNSKYYCNDYLLENLYFLSSSLKFFCCLSSKPKLDYLCCVWCKSSISEFTLTESKLVYRKLCIKMVNATEMPCWKFRAHSLLTDHYGQTSSVSLWLHLTLELVPTWSYKGWRVSVWADLAENKAQPGKHLFVYLWQYQQLMNTLKRIRALEKSWTE